MLAAEGVEGPDPHEHAHDDHGHQEHGHGRDDHGHGDSHAHEPHESPWVMTTALAILGFLGVFGGHFWLLKPWTFFNGHPWFEELVTVESMYGEEVGRWLEPVLTGHALEHHEHLHHTAHLWAVIVSLFVALSGIGVAYLLYVRRKDVPGRVVAALGQVYTTVRRRDYVDEAVDATVIRGTWKLTYLQKWFDENVVDGLVHAVGKLNSVLGAISAWFDRTFVDGAVNAVALLSQVFGAAFRLIQTGRIQQYAAFAIGGAVLTAAWLILA
jgi:NADH-quinone oxidoreductase subunit L